MGLYARSVCEPALEALEDMYIHVVSRAFTLIELLLVISIIAILAANLRQMQLANIGYANEWNGIYVPSVWVSSSGSPYNNWFRNTTYIENLESVAGSDGNNDGVADGGDQFPARLRGKLAKPPAGDWGPVRFSYGYNGIVNEAIAKWTTPNYIASPVPTRISSSQVFAFIDGVDFNVGKSYVDMWTGIEGVNSAGTVARRHRKQANAVFFDGHTEGLDRARLLTDAVWTK